jgi:phage host-nuclease inhibitor protein Gam
MNGKSKGWAIGFLAVVLLFGAVSGAALDRVFVRRSLTQEIERRREARQGQRDGARDRRQGYLDWLSSELDLSTDQQAQVQAIVEDYHEQVSALWRETNPRFEALKSQVRAEIREILNEEQKTKYQALLEKQAERRRHDREDDRS